MAIFKFSLADFPNFSHELLMIFDDGISGQEEIESKDPSVCLTQEHEFMY